MSYTKEPWSVAEEAFDNDGIHESVIRGLDGRAAIAVTLEFGPNNPEMREANARRIVAAVNACAGVPNEQLECDNVEFVRIFNERNELDLAVRNQIQQIAHLNDQLAGLRSDKAMLEIQRDELLAAMIHIQQVACSGSPELGIATDAIASVKGEQP